MAFLALSSTQHLTHADTVFLDVSVHRAVTLVTSRGSTMGVLADGEVEEVEFDDLSLLGLDLPGRELATTGCGLTHGAGDVTLLGLDWDRGLGGALGGMRLHHWKDRKGNIWLKFASVK